MQFYSFMCQLDGTEENLDGTEENKKETPLLTLSFISNIIFILAAATPMVNLSWIGAIDAIQAQQYTSVVLMGIGIIGPISAIIGIFSYISKTDPRVSFFMVPVLGLAFFLPGIITGFAGSCMGIEYAINTGVYQTQTVLGIILGPDITLGLEGNAGIILLSVLIVPAALLVINEVFTFGFRMIAKGD